MAGTYVVPFLDLLIACNCNNSNCVTIKYKHRSRKPGCFISGLHPCFYCQLE